MCGEHVLEPSEEVDERHLELARQAGEAYQQAATHMIEDVANTGDLLELDDYVVGFAQENAEGLYHMRDGDLVWEEPAENQNCHLEIVVAEASTGRFMPEVLPHVTLTDEDGNAVGPMDMPLLWHPGLLHYGRNFELPHEGTYTIEIEIEPPGFPRHDKRNGDRFDDAVTARFEDFDLSTGRK